MLPLATGASRGPGSHSDQGGRYTATRFKHLLLRHGAVASMSRRGNCYDNAEVFWSRFKAERLDGGSFPGLSEAKPEISRHVACYNAGRRHSTLGDQSPNPFKPHFQTTSQWCPAQLDHLKMAYCLASSLYEPGFYNSHDPFPIYGWGSAVLGVCGRGASGFGSRGAQTGPAGIFGFLILLPAEFSCLLMALPVKNILKREILWLLGILAAAAVLTVGLRLLVNRLPPLYEALLAVLPEPLHVKLLLYGLAVLACYLGRLGAAAAQRLTTATPDA